MPIQQGERHGGFQQEDDRRVRRRRARACRFQPAKLGDLIDPALLKTVWPPAAFAVGGAIVGLFLQYLMFPGGRRRRSWLGDYLYALLRGPTVLWCAAAGLFLALEVLETPTRLTLGIR